MVLILVPLPAVPPGEAWNPVVIGRNKRT